MYLFVFVILLVSIIGLYMNVFMIQLDRMTREQTTIAVAMQQWHEGAMNVVMDNALAMPCNLTEGLANSPVTASCSKQVTSDKLPDGYSFDSFKFPSVAYQNANTKYVVTYLPYSSLGAASTSLNVTYKVGNATISLGHSAGEIYQQLTHTSLDPKYYGVIDPGARTIRTPARDIWTDSHGVRQNEPVHYDFATDVPLPSGVAIVTPIR